MNVNIVHFKTFISPITGASYGNALACCCWVLRRSLTSHVISIAFYIEREKFDKFCSEALISAWGSSTCRKYTTRDPRLYFPSEGSHTPEFYALKKIHRTRPGLNPRTSDPEAKMHWRLHRIYGECFPGRLLPNSRTFTSVDRCMGEIGSVMPQVYNRGLEHLGLMKMS